MIDKARAASAIVELLRAAGRDPERDAELVGTGARVADAWGELLGGYDVDVDALLAANVIETASGTVLLKDVALGTMCPHHLMPATGHALVAYEPRAKILGVGALARLVDAYSRRLTLQESIGESVVEALERALSPKWALCKLSMEHTCMSLRGERRHGASLVTLAVRGDRAAAVASLEALA